MLNVASLSCERAYRPLFTELSFSLEPGEIMQVVGNNGAGKTTLLKILLGLYQDYEGTVDWTLEDYPLYISHASGVKGDLTVAENFRWLCSLHDVQLEDAAVRDALSDIGLGGCSNTLCQNLSAGQRKRVSLARLAVIPAACWILDEPFSSIDRDGVTQLEQAMLKHAEEGGSVILTSHQPLSIKTRTLPLELLS